jgi:hypothetical protein
MDGTLAGRVEVPFLHSVSTHVRFLIAIPLLFFAEWRSSSEVRKAVRHLFEIGLVGPDDMEEFRSTVGRHFAGGIRSFPRQSSRRP